MSDRITSIHARQVLDSRGTPTVEVEVHCGNAMGRAFSRCEMAKRWYSPHLLPRPPR